MPGEVVTQGWAARGTGVPEGEWMLLQQIGARLGAFEDGIGRDFKDNCEKRYRQYRGFRRFRRVRERGRVTATTSGSTTRAPLGVHLHIPLTYRTIEHMVPSGDRAPSRMLYLPRLEQWADERAAVRLLIDAQMQQASTSSCRSRT
jgi:hypothetical protein